MAKPDLANYVTVAERIEQFYKQYPEGSLRSEIVTDDGKRIVIKAYAYRTADDAAPATGHAEEIRGDGPVNKTSAVENAETSAVGRAIAMFGFEVKKGIASREEVEQALAEEKRQQSNGKPDQWAAAMRSQIRELDLIDQAKMKLTAMGVERLENLSGQERTEFREWLSKADSPAEVAA